MESILYQGHWFLGGIKHIWMAVWKTNLVLEDLERQKLTKVWPTWGLSSGLNDFWQSEWSVVSWIWITQPSTTFDRGIVHAENFCETSSRKPQQRTKVKPKDCVPELSWTYRKLRFFFQTFHNRWWVVDFRVRSQNQTTKLGVSHEQLTAPEESKNEQIEK
jgi:hypothetical protein